MNTPKTHHPHTLTPTLPLVDHRTDTIAPRKFPEFLDVFTRPGTPAIPTPRLGRTCWRRGT
jgi:hypothetical protein